MEQRKKRIKSGIAFITAIFLLLTSVLVKIQFVDGAEHKADGLNVAVSQIPVKASRGEILDCNGEPLVTNRQGYSLIFKYDEFPSYKDQPARNRLIFSLIKLVEKNGFKWNDILPVKEKKGKFYIDKELDAEFEYLVSEQMLELPEGEKATADACLDALIKRYGLEEYSRSDARKVAAVCFGMKYLGFSTASPYEFCKDVTGELVSVVKENSTLYSGVDSSSVSYREYDDTVTFSHLLGVVGSISAEEYESETAKIKEKLNDDTLTKTQRNIISSNAYSLNDAYGKSGIEALMESELRGKNGIRTVSTNADGTVTEDYPVKPVQGNTVVTTINKKLQQVAFKALKEMLEENRQSSLFDIAGALIVENVNTGEILACVSYPSYDITKYFSEYEKLSENTASPLWNRALQSAYAPGSTFKPCMAIAGLEEKVISKNSSYYCGSTYRISDVTLNCLSSHGYIGVETALEESCNIFFYELGNDLGIDKMNKYAALLGLGQKTGIELPESEGLLASIANREAAGGSWNPGDTVQAAIGQSDNLFTPIQLANYVSTVANGGTRYKPFLIKSVLSSDMSEIISETEPVVLNTLNVSKKNMQIVQSGMRRVITDGGCSWYFTNCIVDAAGKTGTSQINRKTSTGYINDCNNGFFISYAPYDKPEIAVAVVAENVNSGSGISRAAIDVYNYYFSQKEKFAEIENTGTLIP